MAGNPQGGGAPMQRMGQLGNQMQGMRQGMAGMPSQFPGANAAAPGGGMPQFGMAKPMPMPAPGGGMAQTAVIPQFNPGQQGQQMSNLAPPSISVAGPAPQMGGVMPQGPLQPPPPQISQALPMAPQGPSSVGSYQPQISQPLPPAQPQPQVSQPLPQAQPQPMPRPMPRPIPMPPILGNPSAMPLQRPQPQARGQILRGRR